jgi:hypothetical protein
VQYIESLIVAVWALTAIIAGVVWAFSLLTRPAAHNPDLLDKEGKKLHFWASEQERTQALHSLTPEQLKDFEKFHETEEAAA